MDSFFIMVGLFFASPTGPGNDVIANSSQLALVPGQYVTLEQCEAAPLPKFDTVVNSTGADFTYTGTKACFNVVPADKAGANLAVLKVPQNTGVRVQYDGQMIFLPVADMETCENYKSMLGNIEPAWETDLPLMLAGSCI